MNTKNINYTFEILNKMSEKDLIFFLRETYAALKDSKDESKAYISYICSDNNNIISPITRTSSLLIEIVSMYVEQYSLLSLKEIDIIYSGKSYSLEQVSTALLTSQSKQYINISNIKDAYKINEKETWDLILNINKREYLDTNLLQEVIRMYNLNNDQKMMQELLLSIRSFVTLNVFKETNIDIWQTIKKDNNNIEILTLLPFHVSEHESLRRDSSFSRTSIFKRLEFFIDTKDFWQNIPIVKKNIKEYKTKCMIPLTFLSSENHFRKALKSLNIKDSDIVAELSYSIASSTKIMNMKELLLTRNKTGTLSKISSVTNKLIDDNELIHPLIQLLRAEPTTSHNGDLKTTKKNFAKLWNKILPQTNFLDIRNEENLLTQLCKLPIKCYLPINKKFLEKVDEKDNYFYFEEFGYKESHRIQSLIKVLDLFKIKGVDFKHEYNGKIILGNLITTLLSFENDMYIYELFSDKGLITNEIKSSSIAQKENILNIFENEWNNIWNQKRIQTYNETYNIKQYKNSSAVFNALDLLIDECLISNINTLPIVWNKIKEDIRLVENNNEQSANIIKKINMLFLKNALEIKEINAKQNKKLKI